MRKRTDTYQIYKAATTLPISLADAKTHLRITHSSHDDLISDLIWDGVKSFEKRANVCLSAQTWKAFFDKAYEEIELWKYPITGISSIRYYDDDNVAQTLATSKYFSNVDQGSTGYDPRPCVITIEDTPSTYDRDDAVVVTFTAGYTTIDSDVKQAILTRIYRMYENPSDPVSERVTFFDKIICDNRSYGL